MNKYFYNFEKIEVRGLFYFNFFNRNVETNNVCPIAYNVSGIAEGRGLEAKYFNLAQIPNRSKNDCLTENALLLAMPC